MYKVANDKGVILTTGNLQVAMLAATKYRWVMKHSDAIKFIRDKHLEQLRKELARPSYGATLSIRIISEKDELPGENVILGYN